MTATKHSGPLRGRHERLGPVVHHALYLLRFLLMVTLELFSNGRASKHNKGYFECSFDYASSSHTTFGRGVAIIIDRVLQ